MQRIMIIGCGGAGKSHLAHVLHKITGLPLIHLDQYYWMPGWVEPPKDDWKKKVERLALVDEWIMDGNYGGTMDIRISRADTIIFLDVSTLDCLRQVFKRTLQYRNTTRPDMKAGCKERFSWSFFHYILTYRKTRRSGILQKLESVMATKKIFMPRNIQEINLLVGKIESEYIKQAK